MKQTKENERTVILPMTTAPDRGVDGRGCSTRTPTRRHRVSTNLFLRLVCGVVSFMYSYPNIIPPGSAAIRQIVKSLKPFAFERLYGAFPEQLVKTDAKAVERSAEQYLKQIAGPSHAGGAGGIIPVCIRIVVSS